MYSSDEGVIILDGIFFFSPDLIKKKESHVDFLLKELLKYLNFN